MSEPRKAYAEWQLWYTCPICCKQHQVNKDDGVFVICGNEQYELVLPEYSDILLEDLEYSDEGIEFEMELNEEWDA